MRLWTVMLLGCLALGCGDDNNGNNNPQPDLSVVMNPDMIMFGTKHCLALATCAGGCSGAPTCLANCAAMGTQEAQMKYQALGACALGACTSGGGDGGGPACTSGNDNSQGCQDCLSGAATGGMCDAQFTACLND
jgi:hypothetical protein